MRRCYTAPPHLVARGRSEVELVRRDQAGDPADAAALVEVHEQAGVGQWQAERAGARAR